MLLLSDSVSGKALLARFLNEALNSVVEVGRVDFGAESPSPRVAGSDAGRE